MNITSEEVNISPFSGNQPIRVVLIGDISILRKLSNPGLRIFSILHSKLVNRESYIARLNIKLLTVELCGSYTESHEKTIRRGIKNLIEFQVIEVFKGDLYYVNRTYIS